MAQKRMFTMKIVDSDAFLDMPLSTQCLYFHLNMRADDDGFVGNVKRIMRLIGASEDDFKILLAKRFLIMFDNNVVVIKHWWMHNTLSRDRYHETAYTDEKALLKMKDNKSYTMGIEGKSINCIQNVNKMLTESYQDDNEMLTECYQNDNADLDLDIDIDLDKELDKDTADKSAAEKTTKKKKPHSYKDIFTIYEKNFATLYEQGRVSYGKPEVNYSQCGNLIKNLIGKGWTENHIIQAIDRALMDEWIVNKGYSLATILSSNQFNKLINSKGGSVEKYNPHNEVHTDEEYRRDADDPDTIPY